jgi:hypothetical protein
VIFGALVRSGTLVAGVPRAVWRPETPADGDKIAEIDTQPCPLGPKVHGCVSILAILW